MIEWLTNNDRLVCSLFRSERKIIQSYFQGKSHSMKVWILTIVIVLAPIVYMSGLRSKNSIRWKRKCEYFNGYFSSMSAVEQRNYQRKSLGIGRRIWSNDHCSGYKFWRKWWWMLVSIMSKWRRWFQFSSILGRSFTYHQMCLSCNG